MISKLLEEMYSGFQTVSKHVNTEGTFIRFYQIYIKYWQETGGLEQYFY